MGWETRPGAKRRYFYRAQMSSDGRRRKKCLGNGPEAEAAAREIADAAAERKRYRAELADLQAQLGAVDGMVAELDHGVDLLTEAMLLAGGFHEHRGKWRQVCG